jgi:hypothetical protein
VICLVPTFGVLAPPHHTADVFTAQYCYLFNALALPATHVPVGLAHAEDWRSGWGRDDLTIGVAIALEAAGIATAIRS